MLLASRINFSLITQPKYIHPPLKSPLGTYKALNILANDLNTPDPTTDRLPNCVLLVGDTDFTLKFKRRQLERALECVGFRDIAVGVVTDG